MKRKYLALLLATLMLTATLTACGASAPMKDMAMTESVTGGAMAPDYYYEKMESADDMMDSMNGAAIVMPEEAPVPVAPSKPSAAPSMPTEDGKVDAAANTAAQMAEKIIYSANVEMETLEFDATVKTLETTVASIGGFIENSNVSGDTSYDSDGNVEILNRRAWYTVRVPADKFNEFLNFAGEMGNVISNNRSAQNVTSQYTDFEARLESLQVQEDRLLEMMKKSDDINGLITLESRLSDVRYQIESIQRNLKNLDGKLAFSTVDFNIREVKVYKPVARVQRTFWQRLGDSFTNGWEDFVDGWADFTVGLVGSIFPLTVFIVIVIAAVIIIRRVIKKSRKKNAERFAALYPKQEEEKSE